jgi:hypothetical protein
MSTVKALGVGPEAVIENLHDGPGAILGQSCLHTVLQPSQP